MRQEQEMHDPIPAALATPAGRYEIERELGRGGMSIVYLAREPSSGRRVTIKLIGGQYRGSTDAVRRFAREARMAAADSTALPRGRTTTVAREPAWNGS